MSKDKTMYFKTYAAAKYVADTLPPFEPSKFATAREIESGMCNHRINSFEKGWAIQLGVCGAYYPTQNIS